MSGKCHDLKLLYVNPDCIRTAIQFLGNIYSGSVIVHLLCTKMYSGLHKLNCFLK